MIKGQLVDWDLDVVERQPDGFNVTIKPASGAGRALQDISEKLYKQGPLTYRC